MLSILPAAGDCEWMHLTGSEACGAIQTMAGMHFELAEAFAALAAEVVRRETVRIVALLPGVEVGHVGGTSIPGAMTKGDVDLVVRVSGSEVQWVIAVLREVYSVNQPENWSPIFASFKDDSSFPLPLGVQVVVRGSACDFFHWFRQRLVSDPDALARYNEVKRRHEGADAESYREAKTAFIEALLTAENRPLFGAPPEEAAPSS